MILILSVASFAVYRSEAEVVLYLLEGYSFDHAHMHITLIMQVMPDSCFIHGLITIIVLKNKP
jgi:hypothetical protein